MKKRTAVLRANANCVGFRVFFDAVHTVQATLVTNTPSTNHINHILKMYCLIGLCLSIAMLVPFTIAAKMIVSDTTTKWDSTFVEGHVASDGCAYFSNYVDVSATISDSAFRAGAGDENDSVYADFLLTSCESNTVRGTQGSFYIRGPHVLEQARFTAPENRQLRTASLVVTLPVTSFTCTFDPACDYCQWWTDCTYVDEPQGTLTWHWAANATNAKTPAASGMIISRETNPEAGTFVMRHGQGTYRYFEGASENNCTIQLGSNGKRLTLPPLDSATGYMSASKTMTITRSIPKK